MPLREDLPCPGAAVRGVVGAGRTDEATVTLHAPLEPFSAAASGATWAPSHVRSWCSCALPRSPSRHSRRGCGNSNRPYPLMTRPTSPCPRSCRRRRSLSTAGSRGPAPSCCLPDGRTFQSDRVADDLLVARNPDPGSSLPYLIRIPLGPAGIVVKARETWPKASKVYCHRADGWPEDAEIVERHPVRSCSRRGPAIDLVLDRARQNRSQLVLTRARGREVIFWQSPSTSKQARPAVQLPTARASGQVLEIVVDTGEKYPYAFGHQQATTRRRRLPAGDYAVELDGRCRRRRRAQERQRPGEQSAVRQAHLRPGRALGAAAGRRGRRGPVQPPVRPRAHVRVARRGGAGRGPGPIPVDSHRLLRDPSPGTGVGLPVARRLSDRGGRGCRHGLDGGHLLARGRSSAPATPRPPPGRRPCLGPGERDRPQRSRPDSGRRPAAVRSRAC